MARLEEEEFPGKHLKKVAQEQFEQQNIAREEQLMS